MTLSNPSSDSEENAEKSDTEVSDNTVPRFEINNRTMAELNSLPPYPPFKERDGPEIALEWEDWIEGLDAMFDAMDLTDEKQKFQKLFHYLGNTRRTLKKLDNNGSTEKSYDKAKQALTAYFSPQRNSIYLLNQLHHMKQGPSEPMDSFYMRVKEQMQQLKLTEKSPQDIDSLITLAQLVNNTSEPALRT